MKHLLLLLVTSSSLFAQDIYWQDYISVRHPSGATDTAWYGIGDVPTGYNPYLDSLFYGNYDSLQDIRILGFDNIEYDTAVETSYAHLPQVCGDLHRNIKPLINRFGGNFYSFFFQFMVWVDHSGLEEGQYAQLIINGQALQELLQQNLAQDFGFEEDSAYFSYFAYNVNAFDADYYLTQGEIIIENETFDNTEDTVINLQFAYSDPPCYTENGIKAYHLRFYISFHTYSPLGLSENAAMKERPYPNPTQGWLYGLGTEEKQLYTLQGKLLLTSQEEKIDLSPYPPGIYLLQQQHQLQRIFTY